VAAEEHAVAVMKTQLKGPFAAAVGGTGMIQVVLSLGLHRLSHQVVYLLILILEISIFGLREVLRGRLLPQKPTE